MAYARALGEIRRRRKESPWMVECAEALLALHGRSAHEILGAPDDLKLRSCATLFAAVSPPGSVFARLLEKYFRGDPDPRTLELIGAERASD